MWTTEFIAFQRSKKGIVNKNKYFIKNIYFYFIYNFIYKYIFLIFIYNFIDKYL